MIINDCMLDLEASMDLEPAATPWYDMSRYHTNGVVTGATWEQHSSGLWYKEFNSATPDYVVVTCPQCDFTGEDYSILARIKISSLASHRIIFQRGLLNTDGYMFRVHAGGYLQSETYQAAASQLSMSAATAIAVDTSYTVGLSREGNSIRVYRDGVDITVTVGNHIDPTSSVRTGKIGIHDNLIDTPFDGEISFFKIFNYALTAGQQRNWHNKINYLYGGV